MKSEEVIDRGITQAKLAVKDLETKQRVAKKKLDTLRGEELQNKEKLKNLKATSQGKDRSKLEKSLDKENKAAGKIKLKISEIQKEIDEVKTNVLANVKVLGATVAKTYLLSKEFEHLDNIILDEASMIFLPALFFVSGLANQRVIISGDFRQIQPIVNTKQKEIHDQLGIDIYQYNGIEESVNQGKKKVNRMVMLKKQYRMDEKISDLISKVMYGGELKTARNVKVRSKLKLPKPFHHPFTIVDTSSVWPFVQVENVSNSKYNLMHVFAVRNLTYFLEQNGFTKDTTCVGITSPYKAQTKQHIANNKSSPVTARTIHGFQGDEKKVMIIDLVEALGEKRALWDIFLCDHPSDSGSKLWNVAISRAKNNLIVFAHLTQMERRLPNRGFLREILYTMQQEGNVVDIKEILAMRPIKADLDKLGKSFNLGRETEKTGLFDAKDFEKVFAQDIGNAKKSIAIYSGFITPRKVASYHDLFRAKINQKVAIRCVTRPPNRNGGMHESIGKEALDALEGIGCRVDTRNNIHQKAAIIDDEITWFGSLNPLSHNSTTEETMARFDGQEPALQLASTLAIERTKELNGLAVKKENPECGQCSGRTTYMTGRYGPYFKCEDSCGWSANIWKTKQRAKSVSNQLQQTKNSPHKKISTENLECPECGSDMQMRYGRFGPFYGCTQYPKCKGTRKL